MKRKSILKGICLFATAGIFTLFSPHVQDTYAYDGEITDYVEINDQTVTVIPTGEDDTATINYALKSLKDSGGTVILNGTYSISDRLIPFDNTLINADNASITCTENGIYMIDIYQRNNVSVTGGIWTPGNKSAFIKVSQSDNCSLSNAVVKGGGNTADNLDNSDVAVYSSKNLLISDCSFSDTTAQAVYAVKSPKITIANCKVSNTNGYGLHTYFCDEWVIVGNTVTGAYGDGIYCSNNNGGNMAGNTITNTTLNPLLDIDATKNYIARSGCAIFLSITTNANVGKSYTYKGKTYSGNQISNCENYGVALNICSNTLVCNITCKKSGNNSIHGSASATTTISNCKVYDTTGIGIALVPGSLASNTVANATCNNSKIFNNVVNNTTSYGIWVYKTCNTTVAANNISKTKGDGIRCNASKSTKISGNKITDVTNIGSTLSSGISVSNNSTNIIIGQSVTISGKTYASNTITNTAKYGINIDSSTGNVLNNTISKTGNHGILVYKSPSAKINNNKITNSKGQGIFINTSAKVTVYNNTINKTTLDGINISSSPNAILNTNKITKSGKVGINIVNKSAGCTIKNNTLNTTVNHGIYANNCNTAKITNNTLINCGGHGICTNKSEKTTISSNKINKTKMDGMNICASSNVTINSNTVNNAGKVGINIVDKSNYTTLKSNSISFSVKQGIRVYNSSKCNITTMNVPKINNITAKSTKVTGIITNGNVAKIKIGTNFYKCSTNKNSFSSPKLPAIKKGTTVYLYEYPGAGNAVRISKKVS